MTLLQMKSEKGSYLTAFEREYQTTLKVLRAYPEAKAELKPVESSQSAREVAWTLALCQSCVEPILRGDAMMKDMPPIPSTWPEVLWAFEDAHTRSTSRLAELKEDEMNRTARTMVGPKQEADIRVGDLLWDMLNMTIHHRGQLSVYLRIAGGKVPSIYGPSADEPW